MNLEKLLGLFEKAGAITIDNGPLLSSVTVNDIEDFDSNVVVEASWNDDEGQMYEVSFNQRDLSEGRWVGNTFIANDVNGNSTEIRLFDLVPLNAASILD